MKKEKIIGVIGDIHGCYYELCELYNKLLAHTDEIYTVGDFIDRGPDSKSVIKFFIDNNIKPVMGNHEDLLIKAIQKPSYKKYPKYDTNLVHWSVNGGNMTLKSYLGKSSSNFEEFVDKIQECGHYDYILNLPLKIELDNCLITHAGIVKDEPIETVLRNQNIPSKLKKIQVIGHNITQKVIHETNHYINVDTGCYRHGKLSGVVISLNSINIISSS